MSNAISLIDTLEHTKMQETDLNVYFSESLKDVVKLGGDLLTNVKNARDLDPNKIWLIDIYFVSDQVLKFAIANADYIIRNFDEIKPKNKRDACLKLYAYIRYNAYLNPEIIYRFSLCKYEFNIKYYERMKICKYSYNPAHTYIYEHLVVNKIPGFTNESLKAFYQLLELVNLEEKDSHGNSSLDYINQSCVRDQLHPEVLKIHCHNLASDLIDNIQDEINTKDSSTMKLRNKYLNPLRELHKYAKFKEFLKTHDIEICAERNNCKIIITRKN